MGSVNERQLPAKLAALTFMGPGGHVLHRPVKSDILKSIHLLYGAHLLLPEGSR